MEWKYFTDNFSESWRQTWNNTWKGKKHLQTICDIVILQSLSEWTFLSNVLSQVFGFIYSYKQKNNNFDFRYLMANNQLKCGVIYNKTVTWADDGERMINYMNGLK